MPRGLGFEISCPKNLRKDAFLFGESQSRVVVSVAAAKTFELEKQLKSAGVHFEKIGAVAGKSVVVDGENWGPVSKWQATFDTVLEKIMA